MGREIERKFLVKNDAWRMNTRGVHVRQGYLSVGPPVSVRVRVMGDTAALNIKQSTLAIARAEFEYEIPLADANELLDTFCVNILVEKTRYTLDHAGHTWEIDVFEGANAGLIVAEIELDSESEIFPHPDWLGPEVSHDPRYLNTNLMAKPYSTWR